MRSLLVSAIRWLLVSPNGGQAGVTITLAFRLLNDYLRRKLERVRKRKKS